MDKSVRDMYGNFIEVGDYINYPVKGSDSIYMRTAKVLGVVQRNINGEKPQKVLKIAVAIAPRWEERKNNKNWETKIVKTTMSQFYRASVLPKSYVQNDKRYKSLLTMEIDQFNFLDEN